MRIFWSFTRQAFHDRTIYRFDFWLQLISAFFLMYSVYWVWTILYTQRPGAFGVDLGQMVTYGVLGMALLEIVYTGPHYYMAMQVRSGAIDTDLMKPLDFHVHMLARSTGEMLFLLGVWALPSWVMGYLLLDLELPPNGASGLLFGLSLLLGFLVMFHFSFLLGALAIVTVDIRSISWAFNALTLFLSGQIVPLWLFPGWIGKLAGVLPFQSIFYIPLSIYIGRIDGAAAVQAIGFQLSWLALLLLAARLAWGRVQSRLVAQGG